jgi:Domain of unknown function (DUF4266)
MKFLFLVLRLLTVMAVPLLTTGCVMQYERQYLGDPIMHLNHDPEEKSLNNHILPRREGSSGGDGGAGGGCGC